MAEQVDILPGMNAEDSLEWGLMPETEPDAYWL